MGYHQDAMNRMKKCYKDMIHSPLTTLWEGWGLGKDGVGGGSYNHAWSGGPLTVMSSYIAGIECLEPRFKTFSVCPNMGNLSRVRVLVPLFDNRFIELDIYKDPQQSKMVFNVPANTNAILSIPAE